MASEEESSLRIFLQTARKKGTDYRGTVGLFLQGKLGPHTPAGLGDNGSFSLENSDFLIYKPHNEEEIAFSALKSFPCRAEGILV